MSEMFISYQKQFKHIMYPYAKLVRALELIAFNGPDFFHFFLHQKMRANVATCICHDNTRDEVASSVSEGHILRNGGQRRTSPRNDSILTLVASSALLNSILIPNVCFSLLD
jgi:hypothetical protein